MSNEEESMSEKLIKVEKLTPRMREVNIVVKVVSKSEARIVSGGAHKVVDALVGDETGSVLFPIWDGNIEKINVGDTVRITNGYVNLFKGNMQLTIGRYGSFKVLEESPIEEVNTENNLSEKQYEQERRYGERSYRPRYGERRGYRRRY